jgi:hypothetical protein
MQALSRFIKSIEPWHDWGRREISRLDMQCRDFADESYGKVWFFEIQWLGLHLAFEIGPTPRKITAEEIAAYRDRTAELKD